MELLAAARESEDEDEQYDAFFQGRHALAQLVGLQAAASKELWSNLRIIYETAWVSCLSRLIAEWHRKQTLECNLMGLRERYGVEIDSREAAIVKHRELICKLSGEVTVRFLQ